MWIPDAELVWRGAALREDYKGQKQLAVLYEDGEVSAVSMTT